MSNTKEGVIEFIGKGKVDGRDIEVKFKAHYSDVNMSKRGYYWETPNRESPMMVSPEHPKIKILPITENGQYATITEISGRDDNMNNKINVGDRIITETGEEYIFAVNTNPEYVLPYLQIDTETFEVVDEYPLELFEDKVKIGYEMMIGGKITGVLNN